MEQQDRGRVRRGLEPIKALEVEGSGLYRSSSSKRRTGGVARGADKIVIIQVYGMWPGVWAFYSALGIGKENRRSVSACNYSRQGHATEARGEGTCFTCLAHFLWLLRTPSLDLRAQRDFPTLAAH